MPPRCINILDAKADGFTLRTRGAQIARAVVTRPCHAAVISEVLFKGMLDKGESVGLFGRFDVQFIVAQQKKAGIVRAGAWRGRSRRNGTRAAPCATIVTQL